MDNNNKKFWNVHFLHSLKGFSRHVFEKKVLRLEKMGEKQGVDVVLVCIMRRLRSYIEESIDRWKERASHCRGYGVPVRRIEPMIEIWPKRVREYSYCNRNPKTVDGRLRLWQGWEGGSLRRRSRYTTLRRQGKSGTGAKRARQTSCPSRTY